MYYTLSVYFTCFCTSALVSAISAPINVDNFLSDGVKIKIKSSGSVKRFKLSTAVKVTDFSACLVPLESVIEEYDNFRL